MPTTNAQSSLNATCLILPMLTKNLRMAYDDRLNMSRKLFNLSRKRVENLKRNHTTKRSCKRIEKPGDDDWITSGNLGSRDAVLVFRTSVLNTKTKETLISNDADTFNHITNIKREPRSNTNICSNKRNSNCINNPVPSTSRNAYFLKMPINKKTTLQYISDEGKRNVVRAPKNIVHIVNSEKILCDSLSSSDYSISSEGDELEEIEKEDVKIVETADVTNINPTDDAADNGEYDGDERKLENEFDEYSPAPGMPAVDLKLTYKFVQTETKLLRKIFARHGLTESDENENFSILWTGIHMKPDILRNLAPYQRVNHFPRSYELTRKDRLYKNIERMQHLRGLKHFDIIPQSFMLPLEYKDLVTAHNKHRGPWIVKPAASSRGRGIFIVNSPDQIPQDEQVLVSKYVADPLCIDGHKCDLRVYVLVTSFDPLIIYLYEEGLVRLATVKYDLNADNLWNPCMHLCNYSINKYHTDYIKSRDAHEEDVGHKWTLSALLRHLKSQACDTNLLMANIEDLIIKSILSCAQSIISACRMFVPNGNNCFELYGFDILIDNTLKPWLLEVNLSPSMGVDSPLDAKVKSSLITDLLTCVGIPAFSPAMRAHYDSKWSRFRNVTSFRRTSSAEPAACSGTSKRTIASVGGIIAGKQLTLEEQRIIRNARLQNARRGGFVRIFPTHDSMIRYGNFLDATTGIPMSTPILQGQNFHTMLLQHNYNQMLFHHLYTKQYKNDECKYANSFEERISQYERALENGTPILFQPKRVEPKCEEEGQRLRKQILKLIDNGSELTQLQARQTFGLYLEAILRRLTQDSKDCHEKIILKFLNRIGGSVKAPVFFRNPQNIRVVSKARSAMVAKLLGDFLEQYNRDTEAYVDAFDHIGMIPSDIFDEFLTQAQEADLEAVLALNTSLTGSMTYLYNRCGTSVPSTPPIPSGVHGFLKALPSMVVCGSGARDFNKSDTYYRSNVEKESLHFRNKKDSGKK
ncbi:tubulin polyglutamylase TTLL5 isoform X3 [Lucilia cuprina]|uniref:tubulin polyglutamylase TTLL5 isoform X3 n=1 Tax=Lucilia cuprina TaxID=7375 RepID=UPI001F05250B|nr:tubulin polyglutamylase TTLL5 isoform X3 [Lucilia cuprina]